MDKKILTLISGTVAAQIISLLTVPVITRLYTPEDYGLVGIVVALITISVVIVNLGYEVIIPVVKEDKEAIYLYQLCIVLIFVFSMLLVFLYGVGSFEFVFSGFEGGAVFQLFQSDGFLILALFLVTAILSPAGNYALRKKRIGLLSGTKWQVAVINSFVQISCSGFGVVGLLLGNIASKTFNLLRFLLDKSFTARVFAFDIKMLKKLIVEHQKLPRYTMPGSLVNALGYHLTPIIIAAYYGVVFAGFYALANRIMMLPMSLLGNEIGKLFHVRASEEYHRGNMNETYSQTRFFLVSISLPAIITLAFWAPELFGIAFGDQWGEAGEMVRYLAPAVWLRFIVSPTSKVFVISGRQKLALNLQIFLFLSRVLGLIFGVNLGGIETALIMYSVGTVAGFSLYIYFGSQVAGASIGLSWSEFNHVLYRALPVVFICCGALFFEGIYDYVFMAVCFGYVAVVSLNDLRKFEI